MALIVEDGTGRTDADAFVSVDAFKAFCVKNGYDHGDDDALIETAIVRATNQISHSFTWRGRPLKSRSHADGAQSLAWPRLEVTDRDGEDVASNSVPVEVVVATIETARRELEEPEAMSPDYVPADRVKSEKFADVAFTYDLSVKGTESVQPIIQVVAARLAAFVIQPSTGIAVSGSSRL